METDKSNHVKCMNVSSNLITNTEETTAQIVNYLTVDLTHILVTTVHYLGDVTTSYKYLKPFLKNIELVSTLFHSLNGTTDKISTSISSLIIVIKMVI